MMYGQNHFGEITPEVVVLVEEKLRPFSISLSHAGVDADRATAHMNNLAERTSHAPNALALHFRYIGCNRSSVLPLAMLCKVKDGDQKRFLGQALAEIIESVDPKLIPAALLMARMRIVAFAGGVLD